MTALIAGMLSMLLAGGAAEPTPVSLPAATVSGRVTEPGGIPLAGVRIEVVEISRSTVTLDNGQYRLVNLPSGTYALSFTAIGYRPAVRRITVGEVDLTLDVTLVQSAVEIAPVQVTASPLATTSLASPQPLSILSGDELRRGQRASLGAMLESQAGVRNLSTGSGIGKPVIRGLGSNRVLVLADGQRLENQQWGDEHGPNVETADAARIEVIRGPASVLYGSDALGGVINVIPPPLPDASGGRGFLSGSVGTAYNSNNREPEGSLSLEGASGGFGFRASASARRSGDIRTPLGALANSANESAGGTVTGGLRGGWGSLTGTFASRRERLEIHEDPDEEPEFSGYQRVQADRAKLTLNLPVGGSARFAVDAGFERNDRQEYEEAGAEEVGLGLTATTWTSDAHLHHVLGSRVGGIVGLQLLRTGFGRYGEEVLIPENHMTNIGLYAFEQGEIGRWNLSAGLRFDHRRLAVEAEDALGVEAGTLNWSAVTGNVGALYHLARNTALVANVGRGFRAPSAFDLFANGVHEGTVRFERGNPALATETSLNTDLAIRIQSEQVSAELGGFYNRIGGYIYPRPTADLDPESGFRIFDIVQGDARLYGMEAVVEWHASPVVHLRGTADYTNGHNLELDQPLPFIPPFRLTYGLRLEPELRGLESVHLGLNAENVTRQSRLDEADVAPPGYTLLHAGIGLSFPLAGRGVSVDLTARNLLNTEYASFMSRYKEYALDMGRNLALRVELGW